MKSPDPARVAQIHPDEERLADDILLRNETPETAVETVVPIITHDKIMSGGHLTGYAGTHVAAVFLEWKLPYGYSVGLFFQLCQLLMLDFPHLF